MMLLEILLHMPGSGLRLMVRLLVILLVSYAANIFSHRKWTMIHGQVAGREVDQNHLYKKRLDKAEYVSCEGSCWFNFYRALQRDWMVLNS